MMQFDFLSILTPFLLKSAKKWVGAAPKKLNQTRGVCGGSENDSLGQICYVIQYLIDFSAVIYLIGVKEFIFKSFVTIKQSIRKKMAVLRQNHGVRALKV